MEIKVLYEDKNILAIEKPAGLLVHPAPEQARYGAGPDRKKREVTLTDWILKKYPKLKGVGEPVTFNDKEIDRPGIVHRLDRETSGVLLIMKTKEAFAYFKKQFMERKIKKTYYAIVSGFVKKDHDIIDKPIGRSPSDFRRKLAGRGARGELREAVTEYKVLKRFSFGGEKFSYLEIHPKTGRTHQIRVHMKYISHPIVCDPLYNPKGFCPEGLGRLALHAYSIEFSAPKGKSLNGKIVKVESPIPKEFESLVNER